MKKRLALIILGGILLCGFCHAGAEISNTQVIINGVNVYLVDHGRVIPPIAQDGIVYVPLTAFLDALNIPYTVNGNAVIITSDSSYSGGGSGGGSSGWGSSGGGTSGGGTSGWGTSGGSSGSGSGGDTFIEGSGSDGAYGISQGRKDPYTLLSSEEQFLVDASSAWAHLQKGLTRLTIHSITKSPSRSCYVVSLSYQTDDGALTNDMHYVYTGYGYSYQKVDTEESFQKTGFQIESINLAFLQKYGDTNYMNGLTQLVHQTEINRQKYKAESAASKLRRYIESGRKSQSEIDKQRDKSRKETEKLNDLMKQYGIYDAR